jgi:lipopolysaccharide export system protein LptC
MSARLAIAAAAAPQRALRATWSQRLRDQVVAYLPVLLMGLLALSTWWLVKSTPVPEAERAAAPARHEPDYEMTNFLVQRFAADGSLRVQIEGLSLRHYPDTDTLEIEAPRIRAFAPDGRITDASAQRGLANGDASEVQLSGGATVLRGATATSEAIEFRGEFLHAFANTERLRSHLPVQVRRGGTEVRADGVLYDHLAGTIELQGRMRAVLTPRAGRAQ